MGASKVNREEQFDKEIESRKGTWISVGVVGAVILVTYFIVFGLFMARV